MKKDINELLSTIGQLPKVDQDKILHFLLYKKSTLSENDKETIDYLAASSERIKKWVGETDQLLEENKKFFNELRSEI